jgi:hypothetical protein
MKIAVAAESDAGEPPAAARPETISKMVSLGTQSAERACPNLIFPELTSSRQILWNVSRTMG